jgi:hypothetical protein
VEYLEEIFRYEKACWKLAMELRYRDVASPSDVFQVVRFNHDPGPLFEALGRYEAPPVGIPAGGYQVRVRVVGGELEVEWDRASR